jgi:hypothetical protein
MFFIIRTLICALFLALFSLTGHAVSEHTEVLSRSEWPQYENGTNVLALKQIAAIVGRFEEKDEVSVEIRYPSGDPGRQWAETLSEWFVTFGIPITYQELLPGSGSVNSLVIAIIDRS